MVIKKLIDSSPDCLSGNFSTGVVSLNCESSSAEIVIGYLPADATEFDSSSNDRNGKQLVRVVKSSTSAYSGLLTLLVSFALLQSEPASAMSTLGDTWEQLQTRGSADFYKCEYGNAERLLKQAEQKARTFGPDIRLAKSAGELGRLLTIRGRFAEAEPYLEEELRVKEQVLGNENGQLIPSVGSLIRFYLSYSNLAKADPLTELLLDYVDGRLQEAHSPSANKIKLQKGQPLQGWAGEAAPVMRDPLIEWAITCDDIGNLYKSQKKYDMADRLFKAALDVKTTVLGKEHLSLANSYDNLGTLCMEKGSYAEAESYFRDSLMMTEKIQPPENPQVYARLDKLGKCFIKEEKYSEAEELYLRAKDFWKGQPTLCGNESRALFSLGNIYDMQKNYAAAAPVLEQALQLADQYYGPFSVQLVPYLQKYAYTLYYLGRTQEVQPLKDRASELSDANQNTN